MKFYFKVFHFAVFLLLPITINSQMFDESFLRSLPSNVQKDFIDQKDDDPKENKYSNPDTRLKNLEKELKSAESSLAKIRSQLDQESPDAIKAFKRFGDDFFDTYQSTFLPINEPNMGSNYILDVGDHLAIQLVGQQYSRDDDFVRKVERDGSIIVPDVGKISIAGLSIGDAFNKIKNRISSSLIGVEAYISLSELRDINVLIVGNVQNPGLYTLSGGSNPLALINAAGGINPNGSFRSIEHKRNGKIISNIDLYNIFLNGDLSQLIQLRSGDSIVIGQPDRTVRISGGVSNPAIFELLPTDTLDKLLSFSGIMVNSNVSDTLIVQRRDNGEYKYFEIDFSSSSNFNLMHGDSIEIPYVEPEFRPVNIVTISGEVNIPGKYSVPDNTSLKDLIKLAGGYTEAAYPIGGVYIRQSVKSYESRLKERGYNELVSFIVAGQGQLTRASINGDSLKTFLSLLKEYEPSGRLITEFELNEIEENPIKNRILQNNDTIHIPSFMNEVYIFGEVMNPSAYTYDPDASINDYLKLSGGFSRSADDNRVILIYPDGVAENIEFGLFNSLFNNKQILPGTLIYVPQYIGKVDGISLASAVAPILSSFALSIASLNSINN